MESHGFSRKKVVARQSFGQTLKRLREAQKLTLAGAEDQTKIRERYLGEIERDEFNRLPPAHAKGFIRRYGFFLGLDGDTIEAELIHLDHAATHRSLFLPGTLPLPPRWIITPKTVAIGLAIAVGLGAVGYVANQVRLFAAPPRLDIASPKNEAVAQSDELTVSGRTDPGATMSVDNVAADVDANGQWQATVALRPGLNQITIRSVNRLKKRTEKKLTILFSTPSPQPS